MNTHQDKLAELAITKWLEWSNKWSAINKDPDPVVLPRDYVTGYQIHSDNVVCSGLDRTILMTVFVEDELNSITAFAVFNDPEWAQRDQLMLQYLTVEIDTVWVEIWGQQSDGDWDFQFPGQGRA